MTQWYHVIALQILFTALASIWQSSSVKLGLPKPTFDHRMATSTTNPTNPEVSVAPDYNVSFSDIYVKLRKNKLKFF